MGHDYQAVGLVHEQLSTAGVLEPENYAPSSLQQATTWQKADPQDVHQGLLNDCYFLSALTTMSETQHELQ